MTNRFTRSVADSFLASISGARPLSLSTAQSFDSAVDTDLLEGFLLIGSQTTIPKQDLHDIALRWATVEPDNKRGNTARIAKALCQVEWSWGAFDRMVEVLLDDDLWPMPWHRYEKKIKSGVSLEDVRAKIFIQTAKTAAASIRQSKNRNFCVILPLEGWHLYTDSEVGAHYVKKFGTSVLPKDPTTWPPLYPGDVSSIKLGLAGVHSRFGRFFGLGEERPFWADPYK